MVAELLAVRKHAGMMVPTPVQAAMVAALDDDAHEHEQRDRYRGRRDVLLPAFRSAGFTVDHSEAGLYLWVTRGEACRDTVAWLAQRGILAAPGEFYGSRGARHVRVALTATDERIAAAAARLSRRRLMSDYDLEAVDRLPFSTPEKSERYRTENYRGAVGLNWYETDPSLQLTMAYYLQPDELAVAEPHLSRMGELMGGPVARWAEQTDRNPSRLERYDRWGHDISQVVQPTSFTESKTAVLDAQKALKDDARRAGVNPSLPLYAANYLLNQADIGMGCALGTGGGMVKSLVAAYAPADVRDHVLAKFASGEWEGETAQLLTERAGGSDLGALETTATHRENGDAWLLNGFKWFASNCDGQVFVVLAKPEGAPDSGRGVANFLVLRTRRDGSRNGIRIRRLKDKLGTRSVASGEVEFVDAEAFLLSGEPSGQDVESGPADGKGLGRMMELTNAARLGIATVRPGQRAPCPGRVALLRAAAAGVRRRVARQTADPSQACRNDRRRRGRPSAGFRRHRIRQSPSATRGSSAHRGACDETQSLSAGHHDGVGRDRDPRRQRLHRNLAGRPATP